MAADQLNFLIFEPDMAAQQLLRRLVTGFSIRSDVDLRMDWVSRREQLPFAVQVCLDTHIALLNADHPDCSLSLGRQILEANPQCLLVYYGNRTRDLAQYFPARPIAYLEADASPSQWEMLFLQLHRRVREGHTYFHWSGKACHYHIPCRQILTLCSSGGSLQITMLGGSVYTVPGKLDEAQKRLPAADFLRIHKSTLVNAHRIHALDRTNRCLLLSDGSAAYISKAHYQQVLQFMESSVQ